MKLPDTNDPVRKKMMFAAADFCRRLQRDIAGSLEASRYNPGTARQQIEELLGSLPTAIRSEAYASMLSFAIVRALGRALVLRLPCRDDESAEFGAARGRDALKHPWLETPRRPPDDHSIKKGAEEWDRTRFPVSPLPPGRVPGITDDDIRRSSVEGNRDFEDDTESGSATAQGEFQQCINDLVDGILRWRAPLGESLPRGMRYSNENIQSLADQLIAAFRPEE